MADASAARRAWAATGRRLRDFLPFLRGAFSGQAFFFRDLSRQFFPLRRFALEGLRTGRRLLEPLLNEGVPLSLPALSYPLDLLHLLFRTRPASHCYWPFTFRSVRSSSSASHAGWAWGL